MPVYIELSKFVKSIFFEWSDNGIKLVDHYATYPMDKIYNINNNKTDI